jgi:hypothetical protein
MCRSIAGLRARIILHAAAGESNTVIAASA